MGFLYRFLRNDGCRRCSSGFPCAGVIVAAVRDKHLWKHNISCAWFGIVKYKLGHAGVKRCIKVTQISSSLPLLGHFSIWIEANPVWIIDGVFLLHVPVGRQQMFSFSPLMAHHRVIFPDSKVPQKAVCHESYAGGWTIPRQNCGQKQIKVELIKQ